MTIVVGFGCCRGGEAGADTKAAEFFVGCRGTSPSPRSERAKVQRPCTVGVNDDPEHAVELLGRGPVIDADLVHDAVAALGLRIRDDNEI